MPPIHLLSRPLRLRDLLPTGLGCVTALTAAQALSEALLGLHLRHFGTGAGREFWLQLAALTLVRLILSGLRDRAQLSFQIRQGLDARLRLWSARPRGIPEPDLAWRAREGVRDTEDAALARVQLVHAALSAAFLVPALLMAAPPLAAMVVAVLVPVVWASRARARAAGEAPRVEVEAETRHAHAENLAWTSLPALRSLGRDAALARARRGAARKLARTRLAVRGRLLRLSWVAETTAHMAALALTGSALALHAAGQLDVGQVLSFLALSVMLHRPLREASRALPALERVRAHDRLVPDSPFTQPTRQIHPVFPSLLAWKDLRIGQGGFAVDLPDIHVPAGSVLLLRGPAGCGKSTLLRTLAGELQPLTGNMKIPSGPVAWLPQDAPLPPLHPRNWGGPRSADLEYSSDAAERFSRWALEPQGEPPLSRGERARLWLDIQSRVPCTLRLWDEPLAALPHASRALILTDLLARAADSTVVLAWHDPDPPGIWDSLGQTENGLELLIRRPAGTGS